MKFINNNNVLIFINVFFFNINKDLHFYINFNFNIINYAII